MARFLAALILATRGQLIGAFVINATFISLLASRRIAPKQ
jgi:hypothetical protein